MKAQLILDEFIISNNEGAIFNFGTVIASYTQLIYYSVGFSFLRTFQVILF